MSVYIGKLGQLVQLPYVTSQSIELAESHTFTTTLEGRVKSQVRPIRRRTWALSASRYLPNARGALSAFTSGEWGPGPFVWVPVDAPVTNMLTPEQSTCDPSTAFTAGFTPSGPMDLGDDGFAGRSFASASPLGVVYFGSDLAPVMQGRKVTGSVYLDGSTSAARIYWYNSAGAFVSSSTGSTTALPGTNRKFVTAMPPGTAVSARMAATNATKAARPALTWTDGLVAWAEGQGCQKAVVHGLSQEIMQLSKLVTGIRSTDVGFTVTEVG